MMNGGRAAYSNFGNAAYLTEIILLAASRYRSAKTARWNGTA